VPSNRGEMEGPSLVGRGVVFGGDYPAELDSLRSKNLIPFDKKSDERLIAAPTRRQNAQIWLTGSALSSFSNVACEVRWSPR
jgi:hypothetical protein